MRKIITPCLIQKKSDHFLVKFPEYPDCSLKCSDLEDCLDIAPVYLSVYMLLTEQEFVPHTRPLTPKTDNKDQIFTLINCNMDEMQNVLSDFKVSAEEFLKWLTVRTEEPAPEPQQEETTELKIKTQEAEQEPEKEEEPVADAHIPEKETLSPPEPKKIINTMQTADDVDEFDALFNEFPEVEDADKPPFELDEPAEPQAVKTDEPELTPLKEETEETSVEPEKPEVPESPAKPINKNNYRQHPEERHPKAQDVAQPENKDQKKQSPVFEPSKEEPSKKPASEGLKGKVKDMDFEKKNNSGVFGIIEEEEIEFVSNPKNNKPKEKTPASTPNRHQQNFNKKKKNFQNNKKKNSN